jgi:hypothetical protein
MWLGAALGNGQRAARVHRVRTDPGALVATVSHGCSFRGRPGGCPGDLFGERYCEDLDEGADLVPPTTGFVGKDSPMSSPEEARNALYAAIAKQARAFEGEAASESKAASIRELAEALAWLEQPGQPH